MSNMLFMIKHDFKRIFTVKRIVLLFIVMVGILSIDLQEFRFVKTQLNSVIFPLIIIIIASKILNREFECGTYKYLFTGSLSRNRVILCKVLSLCTISVVLALVASCISFTIMLQSDDILSISFVVNQILNSELVFILFTLLITSIAFFISIISRSFIGTFLIMYLFFYDMFRTMLQAILQKLNIDIMNKILDVIPMFNVLDGFKKLYYPANTAYVMIGISVVVFCIDLLLINKKDL